MHLISRNHSHKQNRQRRCLSIAVVQLLLTIVGALKMVRQMMTINRFNINRGHQRRFYMYNIVTTATALINHRTFKRRRFPYQQPYSAASNGPSKYTSCRTFSTNLATVTLDAPLIDLNTVFNDKAIITPPTVERISAQPPSINTLSRFRVTAQYAAAGDQPYAIQQLTQQIQQGDRFSVLKGITGTGKTFVMSHVIANIGKPCLVLCHNKTLAAQLARELRSFLSTNAVELFVSYYNMYRPEAYIEKSGTYLKKKSSVNLEIDALRHRATRSLLTRNDVVVVASVSCIYGLGFPKEYIDNSHEIRIGDEVIFHDFCKMLERMLYSPSDDDDDFERGKYQVTDGVMNDSTKNIILWAPHDKFPMRIQLEPVPFQVNDEHNNNNHRYKRYSIKSIADGNESGFVPVPSTQLFPAKHHIVSDDTLDTAMELIEQEMRQRVRYFRAEQKPEEAERIQARVIQDLELLREHGYCHGCENYSRHFAQREEGEPPDTLLDYFGFMGKRDWLLMVDESHATLSQLSAMHNGDRERKLKLVKHGYRLPSALDNRPLKENEFWKHVDQALFVSATPSKLNLELSDREPVEMIIRPTFLCDPVIEVRSSEGQLQDFVNEVKNRAAVNQRTLAVAFTKKDAEDMSTFLIQNDVKSQFIHCDLNTNERADTLKALQDGTIDCLVGVNLLREGLDLPQVSLVAIFSCDPKRPSCKRLDVPLGILKERLFCTPKVLIIPCRNVLMKQIVVVRCKSHTTKSMVILQSLRRGRPLCRSLIWPRKKLKMSWNAKFQCRKRTLHAA
jgi:excinuclease ABC subunit B